MISAIGKSCVTVDQPRSILIPPPGWVAAGNVPAIAATQSVLLIENPANSGVTVLLKKMRFAVVTAANVAFGWVNIANLIIPLGNSQAVNGIAKSGVDVASGTSSQAAQKASMSTANATQVGLWGTSVVLNNPANTWFDLPIPEWAGWPIKQNTMLAIGPNTDDVEFLYYMDWDEVPV